MMGPFPQPQTFWRGPGWELPAACPGVHPQACVTRAFIPEREKKSLRWCCSSRVTSCFGMLQKLCPKEAVMALTPLLGAGIPGYACTSRDGHLALSGAFTKLSLQPRSLPASTQINLIFRLTNLSHCPGSLIKYSCPFLPLCLLSMAELLPFYHSRQDSLGFAPS